LYSISISFIVHNFQDSELSNAMMFLLVRILDGLFHINSFYMLLMPHCFSQSCELSHNCLNAIKFLWYCI
jgi:hypothetical protein